MIISYLSRGWKLFLAFPYLIIFTLVYQMIPVFLKPVINLPFTFFYFIFTFVCLEAFYRYPEAKNFTWGKEFLNILKRMIIPGILLLSVLFSWSIISFFSLVALKVDMNLAGNVARVVAAVLVFITRTMTVFHGIYFAVEKRGFFESMNLSLNKFSKHAPFKIFVSVILLIFGIPTSYLGLQPPFLEYGLVTLSALVSLILSATTVVYYKEKVKSN